MKVNILDEMMSFYIGKPEANEEKVQRRCYRKQRKKIEAFISEHRDDKELLKEVWGDLFALQYDDQIFPNVVRTSRKEYEFFIGLRWRLWHLNAYQCLKHFELIKVKELHPDLTPPTEDEFKEKILEEVFNRLERMSK